MENEYFAKKDETIGYQACKKTKNSLLGQLGPFVLNYHVNNCQTTSIVAYWNTQQRPTCVCGQP